MTRNQPYIMFTPRGGLQPWMIDLHVSQAMWDLGKHNTKEQASASAHVFLQIIGDHLCKC